MPRIKYQDVLEAVKKQSVFGVDDLVQRGVPRDYAKTLLYRLNKKGDIARVEQNKYTTLEDPLLVAPSLTHPCYLSLWTALRLQNITQQSPFTVEVVTSRSRYNNELEFNGTKINFYKVKPELMFGYSYQVHGNSRIPLASAEKAVIDGLYLGVIPVEEVRDIISELEEDQLRDYASRASPAVENKIKSVID